MGEKKGKGEEGDKEKKKETPEESGITVVLKTEMHCEGCATKILKAVKTIQEVERAKADWESNKLTVKGEMEPEGLRDELQEKLGKKVELISPKKDKDSGGGGDKAKGDSKKHDAKKDNTGKKDDGKSSGKDSNKSDEKKAKEKDKEKEKEAPVTTAVLKLRFHCTGCIVKIHKIVSKTPGVEGVAIDKGKELVTVTGTMDVKALAESLQEKMKTSVNIVAPKKDKDDNGGDGKNNKKGDAAAIGEDNAETGGGGGGMFEGNRMEYVGLPMPNYGPSGYGPGIMYGEAAGSMPGFGYALYNPNPYANGNNLHAPQIFSDENPNACSIM